MQAVLGNVLVLVIFNLGGGEIVVILALVFILFGARRLPDLGRGLGRGIWFAVNPSDAAPGILRLTSGPGDFAG